jgi:hypothetical protein
MKTSPSYLRFELALFLLLAGMCSFAGCKPKTENPIANPPQASEVSRPPKATATASNINAGGIDTTRSPATTDKPHDVKVDLTPPSFGTNTIPPHR